MLTVYEAMQRRANTLAREREQGAAEERQREHELREREEQVAGLVREYVEATQDFSLEGIEIYASESIPRLLYKVSFRIPGQDGRVRATFTARKGELGFGHEFLARDANDEDEQYTVVHSTLIDALLDAYMRGEPVPAFLPREVEA